MKMEMPRSIVNIAVLCSCVIFTGQAARLAIANAAEVAQQRAATSQRQNDFELEAMCIQPMSRDSSD